METYPLPHHQATVHLALFHPIHNAAALRSRLVSASTLAQDEAGNRERAAVDFAFVDARMITSRLHLLTAVQQALLAQADGALKTKTLHSEVLWMLEPGTNITDSLKHFGLSPSTASLVLVHIAPSTGQATAKSERTAAEDVLRRMAAAVEGEVVSLEALGRSEGGTLDEKAVRKVYKLNQDTALKGLQAGSDDARATLDRLVTSSVALKVAM
ncbi:uncharacterized protein RHOBADRAFT_51312 [Rhodotorula graminis WP1]|uniref:EKC/KEOPS complex subunit CGI121 n=1 Tax=Rhodotorula graminis (strain WP1) TaxID=578459 RepID=A0A194SA30_RHOGW|nr:uncharacterized protein RHOBADRAFT_51312 [Rhodotorula graminis WP1]KPV77462.1 hypothetical protein RHOBADRAFT_51312 [Rhodotorula graminis WP1]